MISRLHSASTPRPPRRLQQDPGPRRTAATASRPEPARRRRPATSSACRRRAHAARSTAPAHRRRSVGTVRNPERSPPRRTPTRACRRPPGSRAPRRASTHHHQALRSHNGSSCAARSGTNHLPAPDRDSSIRSCPRVECAPRTPVARPAWLTHRQPARAPAARRTARFLEPPAPRRPRSPRTPNARGQLTPRERQSHVHCPRTEQDARSANHLISPTAASARRAPKPMLAFPGRQRHPCAPFGVLSAAAPEEHISGCRAARRSPVRFGGSPRGCCGCTRMACARAAVASLA